MIEEKTILFREMKVCSEKKALGNFGFSMIYYLFESYLRLYRRQDSVGTYISGT